MIAHRNVLCSRQSLDHSRIFRSLHIDIATIDKRDGINRFSHQSEQRIERHILVNDLTVLEHIFITIGPAHEQFTRSRFRFSRSIYIALMTRIMVINLHLIIKDNSVNRQIRFISKNRIIIVTGKYSCIFGITAKSIEFPCKLVCLHFFCSKSENLCKRTSIRSCHISNSSNGLVEVRANDCACICTSNTAHTNILCRCRNSIQNGSAEIRTLYVAIFIKITNETSRINNRRFRIRSFSCLQVQLSSRIGIFN